MKHSTITLSNKTINKWWDRWRGTINKKLFFVNRMQGGYVILQVISSFSPTFFHRDIRSNQWVISNSSRKIYCCEKICKAPVFDTKHEISFFGWSFCSCVVNDDVISEISHFLYFLPNESYSKEFDFLLSFILVPTQKFVISSTYIWLFSNF